VVVWAHAGAPSMADVAANIYICSSCCHISWRRSHVALVQWTVVCVSDYRGGHCGRHYGGDGD
jgi:hypothetical protein